MQAQQLSLSLCEPHGPCLGDSTGHALPVSSNPLALTFSPPLCGEGLRGDLQPGLSLLLTFGSHGLYYDDDPYNPSFFKVFFFLNKNKDVKLFPKAFHSTINVIMWFLTLCLFLCCITFTNLCLLSQSCILEVNITFS